MANDLRSRAASFLSRRMLPIAVVAGLAIVAIVIAVPVTTVDASAVYERYHDLTQQSENLRASAHKELACSDCHRGAPQLLRQVAVAADFYVGLVGGRTSAVFTRFPAPDNEACLSCHRGQWSDEASRTAKVPHPAHPRVASETRSCVKCHKWTAHEEAYMQKHKTMPFSGVCAAYGCHVGTKQTEECASCHHSLAKGGDWKTTHPEVALTAGTNSCLEACHEIDQCRGCHTTGKQPKVSGVPVQSGLQQIQTLHVKSDWTEQHGQVAAKDPSQCMKCHVSDGECRQCHSRRPAFHGSTESWIGRHKDVAPDKKLNDPRCVTACHEKKWCEECHQQFKEMR